MTNFSDHFGKVAGRYADFRPTYPPELFDWLAAQCGAHELVWDCGCGNGQASVALAAHFRQVHATDASAGQIEHATPHAQVRYATAPASASGLPDASADLITVAQALHWFADDSFYDEARRVLKPDGLLAAWSYGMIVVEGDAVNDAIQHFYHQVIGPYWPPERRHVETGYCELPFPFTRIATPELAMQVSWPLAQLLGYLGSWSASARYREATGKDAVEALGQVLLGSWGDPARPRTVSWPLAILAGRP